MFKKIIETVTGSLEEKKEYKAYKKRIDNLPTDYKNAMVSIETYMWSFCADGTMLKELYNILDMLEENVSDGRKVTDIVGNDITAFCDDILKEIPEKTWMNSYKEKIQKRINKKIDKNK